MVAPSPSVSSVYFRVVDDVIIKVRGEFLASGSGDDLLDELQGLWETKLRQCGAVSGSFSRPLAWRSSVGVHDLNEPYAGSEVYQTPTADLLFPPTPFETPIQTALPGNVDQFLYHMPTPAGLSDNDDPINYDIQPGKPNSYMDFFSASAKRKRDDSIDNLNSMGNIPQRDGTAEFKFEVTDSKQSFPKHDDHHSVTTHGEIYHANVDNLEDVEPPLNEDDDIVDDFDQIYGEPDSIHLVLAQFDKVTRTKNKWKCILRNGIMHINSRDILFDRVGEGQMPSQGVVTHITGGNFAQSSITINGWLRDFLWAQASQANGDFEF